MEKEFIELINIHNGILHKICNIYFYSNPYKEDYYQELLIRLWRAYPGFRGQSAFSTWLYRVALNAAIDILRKEIIYPTHIEFSQNEYEITLHNQESESEEKEKLYRAINKLSDIERAIIILYLEEYEYKEIAAIVGISESNTGVKINRIKNKLIKILEHESK